MASSPKIDSFFDEFIGELITIPPRIVNREHEEYISLMEREEIDIFPGSDDSIPPGIENDDYDSEGDDNSTSLPGFESFHVDYPNSGDSTIDVVEDIPVDVPNIFPTHPTLHMDFDFILLIMISDLILMFLPLPEIETRFTIRGYALNSNPRDSTIDVVEDIPVDVPNICLSSPFLSPLTKLKIAPDYEASRACGFVLRSLELQHPQLHIGNPISKSYRLTFICTGYSLKDKKRSQNQQNRAREWKEREKSKSTKK
ncbi:hypothetical protein Tco_1447838 [Tanacetum coccineum]